MPRLAAVLLAVTGVLVLLASSVQTLTFVVPSAYVYEVDDFVSGGKSPTVSDRGELGWQKFGGNTGGMIAAEAGRPGIHRIETTTTSGNVSALQLNSDFRTAFAAAEVFDIVWICRLAINDANTRARAGLNGDAASAIADPPTDGIYFEKLAADTTWFIVTRAASTETRTDTGITTSTSFVRFRVRRVDSSTIGFTLNTGTEQTHTTNIPTVGLVPWASIVTATTASRQLDMDLFSLTITGLSR